MATQAVPATGKRLAPVIGIANAAEAARDTLTRLTIERPLGATPLTDAERVVEFHALTERLLDERADLLDTIRRLEQELRLVAVRTMANAEDAMPREATMDVGGAYAWGELASFAATAQNLERHGFRIAVRLTRGDDGLATGLALALRVPIEPTCSRDGGR